MKRLLSVFLVLCLSLSHLCCFAGAESEKTPESEIEYKSGATISLDVIKAENAGVGVLMVEPGSLAEKAGIEYGDIIVAIGGQRIKDNKAFLSAWESYSDGNKFEMDLMRRGLKYSIDVTKNSSMKFGISVGDTPTGAIVKSVTEGGSAEKAGIKTGDIIVGLNHETVLTPMGLQRILSECQAGQVVELEYLREDLKEVVEIRLGTSEFSVSNISIMETDIHVGDTKPLFSIQATGDLDLKKAFEWMKEEKEYDLWAGLKSHDKRRGLRIENTFDEETGVYTSTLWADDIKKEASSEYFCVVKDMNLAILESGQVTLKVK